MSKMKDLIIDLECKAEEAVKGEVIRIVKNILELPNYGITAEDIMDSYEYDDAYMEAVDVFAEEEWLFGDGFGIYEYAADFFHSLDNQMKKMIEEMIEEKYGY